MSSQPSTPESTSLSQEQTKITPFAHWPPPPCQARKTAGDKKNGLEDKRTTMQDAVAAHLKDGIHLGIGGFVNIRLPAAIIHEIVRHGAKDLTLSFQSSSICSELLAGAMILDPDHFSITRIALGLECGKDIENAPLTRYLADRGMIHLDKYTYHGMSARFKAAATGVPFFPTLDQGGIDLEGFNRGTKMKCPFSGDDISVVPACRPDVGIVHVQAADKSGNARIFGPLCTCPEIARAATHTIMSVDQIIPNEKIRAFPNVTDIPSLLVDELVEQPFGATPGASYGHYWFDMSHYFDFWNMCDDFYRTGNKDRLQDYYDRNIMGCETFEDFLSLKSPETLQEIIRKDGSQPLING